MSGIYVNGRYKPMPVYGLDVHATRQKNLYGAPTRDDVEREKNAVRRENTPDVRMTSGMVPIVKRPETTQNFIERDRYNDRPGRSALISAGKSEASARSKRLESSYRAQDTRLDNQAYNA